VTNVSQFPSKEELAQRTKGEFNADFKKRWKARGDCGEFTNDIWAWQEMLEDMGWIVQFYDQIIPEFTAFVNFDKKLLTSNVPKAYHMQQMLAQIIDRMFEGATGRFLYEWKEVHDDAHRRVYDGDEYKDSEYYMMVWYAMELFSREMADDEDIPAKPVEVYTGPKLLEDADDGDELPTA
jgi:hypothetical protein